jgi:hypothetical protein
VPPVRAAKPTSSTSEHEDGEVAFRGCCAAASWQYGRFIVLVRNPNFLGDKRPQVPFGVAAIYFYIYLYFSTFVYSL